MPAPFLLSRREPSAAERGKITLVGCGGTCWRRNEFEEEVATDIVQNDDGSFLPTQVSNSQELIAAFDFANSSVNNCCGLVYDHLQQLTPFTTPGFLS